MTFQELLLQEFAPYGQLTAWQCSALESHYNLLLKWNEKLNLTRITALEDSIRFHYCESMFLGTHLPPGSYKVADIGSGAGFPGIPVAILRPELQIDLIESHQRKAVFLREATRELSSVTVRATRAENLEDPRYQWQISRAVVPEDVLKWNLASSTALLIGDGDAAKLHGKRTPLPWGTGRVLFHVER